MMEGDVAGGSVKKFSSRDMREISDETRQPVGIYRELRSSGMRQQTMVPEDQTGPMSLLEARRMKGVFKTFIESSEIKSKREHGL
jgi:hypothetical protein